MINYLIQICRADGTWVEVQKCYSSIVASCWIAFYSSAGFTVRAQPV